MNVKFLERSNAWSGTSNTQQHPSMLQHPSTYQQGRKALASRKKELDEQQQVVEEEREVLKRRSDEVVVCHKPFLTCFLKPDPKLKPDPSP